MVEQRKAARLLETEPEVVGAVVEDTEATDSTSDTTKKTWLDVPSVASSQQKGGKGIPVGCGCW